MLYNSFPFIFLFLPLTLALFHALRRTPRLALLSLVCASLFFYAYWDLFGQKDPNSPTATHPYNSLLLLLLSIAFNYTTGTLLKRSRRPHARATNPKAPFPTSRVAGASRPRHSERSEESHPLDHQVSPFAEPFTTGLASSRNSPLPPSPGTPREGRGEGSAPRPSSPDNVFASTRGMGDPPMHSLQGKNGDEGKNGDAASFPPPSPLLPPRLLLTLAISVNLLALCYFKYANFLLDTYNSLLGAHVPALSIALPLGISFFTFTQIAFLVDCYNGNAEELNLPRYTLFVTFFPHLIAGPIVHHSDLMPQFAEKQTFRWNPANVSAGLALFTLGLFKKVAIADTVGPWASAVFDSAQSPTFLEAWSGALSYTFQLYFDFSAYSDMAIGLALLFNTRLPDNFNAPYRATSPIDFWARWHITLSRFLRDYLYIPLGGNRKGPTRRYANLLITMLLGGLWHGAGLAFLLWGLYHGLLLCVAHLYRSLSTPRPERPRPQIHAHAHAPTEALAYAGAAASVPQHSELATQHFPPPPPTRNLELGTRNSLSPSRSLLSPLPPVLSRPLTFLAILLGWVLFRSGSIPHTTPSQSLSRATEILLTLFSPTHTEPAGPSLLPAGPSQFLLLILLLFFVNLLPTSRTWLESRPRLTRRHAIFLATLFILSLLLLRDALLTHTPNLFIYFQF